MDVFIPHCAFFPLASIGGKGGSWDKNWKAMNDEATEQKIATFIFFGCYLCLSIESVHSERLSFLPASVLRILLFLPRIFCDTFNGVLNGCCTNRKRIKNLPFSIARNAINGAGLRYLRGSNDTMIFAIFWNIHVIDASDCIDVHFHSHKQLLALRVPASQQRQKRRWKKPLRIYAQFKNL